MSHPVDRHVGGRIRQRREELGLTAAQLAARLGITHQQMSKIELGHSSVNAQRIVKLSKVLRVTVAFFFDGGKL